MDRMDCEGRDTETGETRLWSLRTCLRLKPFACPGLRLVGILRIAMDSRRRWQTVCCRWCPPNSQMVFAGKAARFVSVYEAGWVSSCQVIHWVGIHGGNVEGGYGMLHGCRFELSILFNAQGLPEVGGSVWSRIHHLTLEFADLFSFKFPSESTFDQMMSSIALFASLGLHSSLLVPFKRTFSALDSPQHLGIAFCFHTCFTDISFSWILKLLQVCVVARRSQSDQGMCRTRVPKSCWIQISATFQGFGEVNIFRVLPFCCDSAFHLWSRWFPASRWNLGGADIVSSHRNWTGLPGGKIGTGRALLAGLRVLRHYERRDYLQFLFSIVDVLV